MTLRPRYLATLALVALLALVCSGCSNSPGRPSADAEAVDPDDVSDFPTLYAHNCAGCHGTDGKGGAALSLADPTYLAIADESVLRRVTAVGVPRTQMPAFAKSAGGMLTDRQIDIIAHGMRERWSKRDALRGANPPPYSALVAGDASRGSGVYATYCASCHGTGGNGGKASSIANGSYLALVSDQGLRTVVIVGRPELGAPDWRGNGGAAGKPMSAQDISDVVAWLASQRASSPARLSINSAQPAADRTAGESR
jgi:cytochrome c oxidase cbb3-type subunit III